MLRLCGFAAIAALVSVVSAGAADKVVELPLMVWPGQTLSVDYSKTKISGRRENILQGRAELVIEEAFESTFRATWRNEQLSVNGVTVPASVQPDISLLNGSKIDFIAGVDGQPLSIAAGDALRNEVINNDALYNGDEEIRSFAQKLFNSLDDESLSKILLKIPALMSICQSMALIPGETVQSRNQRSSPFGPGAVSSIVSYELATIDQSAGVAAITYSSEFDSESITAALKHLNESLPAREKMSKRELDALQIRRADRAECAVDTATGWVKEMKFRTDLSQGSETAAEEYQITVVIED